MEERIPIVCYHCSLGCRTFVRVREGYPVNIEYMKNYPDIVNEHGKLCSKGNAILSLEKKLKRIKSPLKKKENGEFVEISWNEAIRYVVESINSLRDNPDKMAFIGSLNAYNESSYVLQKFSRVLGSNNIDSEARFCYLGAGYALLESMGYAASTNTIKSLEKSECIVIWGHNLAETQPIAFRYVLKARDKGATIIVIDPRFTKTARFSDIYIKVRPGKDLALANGIINVILNETLYDADFIEKRCEGFEIARQIAMRYDLKTIEEITGVSAAVIMEVARRFAKARTASVIIGTGVTQSINAKEITHAIVSIALMCGHVGKPGSGVYIASGKSNIQGVIDMGVLPDVLPGHKSLEDREYVEFLERKWGYEIPKDRGLSLLEFMEGAEKGHICGIYTMGEDILHNTPNTERVLRALEKLEFLIVQDSRMTPTAELADVIMPRTTILESEGSLTSIERRIQWSYRVISPPKNARPDWWIIKNIAKELDIKGFEYSAPDDIFKEIATIVPQYRGITINMLKESISGVFWPRGSERTLYLEKFNTRNGRAKIKTYDVKLSHDEDKRYPLILITVRYVDYTQGFVTGFLDRFSKAKLTIPRVEINPEDAQVLGISEGDFVRIDTERGSYPVICTISNNVEKGTIAIPWHMGVNIITSDRYSKDTKIPDMKRCRCRIVRISREEFDQLLRMLPEHIRRHYLGGVKH
ncbi:MAG: formate dehydrogenase subunit alpha [Thermoplasmata archaeon]|nr:molybdopterin-dependent oxidoreductase [Euryarchaeota archaeon]RLF67217.1 MAG: formate dehydrogenase subunit alpha [Thermoplasmata archaeon]